MNFFRNIVLFFLVLVLFSACFVFRPSKQIQQARTVDAIRDLGTAIEAYKLNNDRYPVLTSGHVSELESELVPRYLRKLRDTDGWGAGIEYYCSKPEGPYYIISLGSDKERDVGLYQTDRFPSGLGFKEISNIREDIIFSNGVFVRYPRGTQLRHLAQKTQ